MKIPKGLSADVNMVCKLKKSLYGLKQASRQWFARLVAELLHQGFLQSKNDYSLFIRNFDDCMTIIFVYVDNILLTGDSQIHMDKLKQHLYKVFSIKDLGHISLFLGIERFFFG